MTPRRSAAIILVFTVAGALIGAAIGVMIGEFFPEFTIGLFGAGEVTALNPVRLSIGMGLANGAGFGCVGGMVAVVAEALGRRRIESFNSFKPAEAVVPAIAEEPPSPPPPAPANPS